MILCPIIPLEIPTVKTALDVKYGMSEITKLLQAQVKGEKNTGPQKEDYKPLVTSHVIVQKEEKFVDFLHTAAIRIMSIWKQ